MSDNYKILYFNTRHADIYNKKDITFFFKNPIVLEEEYILKVGCLNFYQSGTANNFIDETNIGVIFNTNYGFDFSFTEGVWHYKIPLTDLTLVIEIYDPLFATRSARILDVIYNGGYNDPSVIFQAQSANDYIEIPNADVVRISDGTIGWYKSASSGPLRIRINTIQQTFTVKEKIKISIDNLKYNNSKYITSDKNFATIFDNIQFDYKNIQSRLMLKKNNIY